jgi:hypothetical protein
LVIRLSRLMEEVNVRPLIPLLILLFAHISLSDLRSVSRSLMVSLLLEARNLLRLLNILSQEVLVV